MNRISLPRFRGYFLLSVVSALSLYYLYRAITYRFVPAGRLGPTLFNKQFWYFSHLIFALPVLSGAPLQFIAPIRARAPHWHRAVGKAYVVGACGAALLAIYLGAIVGEYEGSRLSLALTGSLWLFFTLAAWRLAVGKNFVAHRAFMIRSYTMALVLVWLRLMYDFQDYLFFYVTNPDLRDATREWASWVVPLLVVELWLAWIPTVRGRKRA
ncbi:MAG: DUF2306 domain-containing protein [Gemmatimonadetes bacterium]|nr:DUF2306 domain-containing protein [Gemmatimonadota bacterium]